MARSDTALLETHETAPGNSASDDLRTSLQEILSRLAHLSERVAGLEQLASMSGAETGPVASAGPIEAPAAAPVEPARAPTETSSLAADAVISEEEVLAISAALAAWLGLRAHIRQIRLIRTGAWAQQGRVSIQASHHLNY